MSDPEHWHASAESTSAGRGPVAAVEVPVVGWWFVGWRARVLGESTGDVEARLTALAQAMERLDMVGGLPAARLVGPSSVLFEFWFEAASAREAAGGAAGGAAPGVRGRRRWRSRTASRRQGG